MTRKEVKVSVKMRTNGGIYVCPNIMGDIIVYEDQLVPINNRIGRCRTREEAKEIIHDFGCGLDLHHSDVQIPTIRKKNARQPIRSGTAFPRKPIVQPIATRMKKPSDVYHEPSTPVRIISDGDIHEIE